MEILDDFFFIAPAIPETIAFPIQDKRLQTMLAWYATNKDLNLGTGGKDEIRRLDSIFDLKNTLQCPICESFYGLEIERLTGICDSCKKELEKRTIKHSPTELQLHHKEGGYTKLKNVASVFRSWEWRKVCDEVMKCDVMCACDHTYLTQKLRPFMILKKRDDEGNRVIEVKQRMAVGWWQRRLERQDVVLRWTGNSMAGIINKQDELTLSSVDKYADDIRIDDIVWCSVGGYTYCHFVKMIQTGKNKNRYWIEDRYGKPQGFADEIYGVVSKINGEKYC